LDITIISPYHGGSHRAWAEGFSEHSTHQVNLLTLPARFWKWRMHGGAVTLARRFLKSDFQPDLLLATDMLDLATFLALTRARTSKLPAVLYMHENQLTYPLPEDGSTGPMRRQLGERDRHYAFTNYTSMMVSDCILFNSSHHLNSFFAALPGFLKHFPEYNEMGSIKTLRSKSEVLHLGIDLNRLDLDSLKSRNFAKASSAPLILWNQRWEYDKNPEDFFNALFVLADEGVPFRLALCGQQYGKQPPSFKAAIKRLGERIIHTGFASPEIYSQLLWDADIVVSTAHHEFFGISILEAIYAQSFPILPARLSYPELIPAEVHEDCLYLGQEALTDRLRWALSHPHDILELAQEIAKYIARYDWIQLGPIYDETLNRCAKLAV
jgi:glycosyltransferase involved in cell wall biosynthesis